MTQPRLIHMSTILSTLEQDEMKKWYTESDASVFDSAKPITEALPLLMNTRPFAFKHVWDINFGPYFQTDLDKVPADVEECALSNIAVMSAAKFPGTMGNDIKAYGLIGCEIGKGYNMLYDITMRKHQIIFHYLRKYGTAFQGNLRVVLPDATSRSYEDGIGDIITKSYQMKV